MRDEKPPKYAVASVIRHIKGLSIVETQMLIMSNLAVLGRYLKHFLMYNTWKSRASATIEKATARIKYHLYLAKGSMYASAITFARFSFF